MKIEKISENQIKFILNQTDLNKRDIKFTELEYGSEKTQDLFQEMLEQANEKHGFISDSIPLVIEAIPLAKDSLMVLVTKLDSIPFDDHRASIFAGLKDFNKNNFDTDYLDFPSLVAPPATNKTNNNTNISIFVFEDINEIINISKLIIDKFTGLSSVYKYNHAYYLVLENAKNNFSSASISEFGNKYSSTIKSKYHLMEHGEEITKENAVPKYALI